MTSSGVTVFGETYFTDDVRINDGFLCGPRRQTAAPSGVESGAPDTEKTEETIRTMKDIRSRIVAILRGTWPKYLVRVENSLTAVRKESLFQPLPNCFLPVQNILVIFRDVWRRFASEYPS